MADQTVANVGFIGVGNMGGRMAARLLEGGVGLLVTDLSSARVDEAVARGARAAELGELVRSCEIVLCSLPDSHAVEAVMGAADGIVANARQGQVVVDLSTSQPTSTRQLSAELAGRGTTLLDAGISGGAAGADKGTLTLMVGGDEAVLDRVRPILDHFAEHIYYMGETGAGHTTKILNNFLNGVSLAASAEVMVAAAKVGLDLARVLEVINHSSGVNFATLNRFPRIIEGDYLEGGLTGELMAKDVALYVDLVEELRVASLLAAPCLSTYRIANALGYGDVISNRVVDALGDLSGGVRLTKEKS